VLVHTNTSKANRGESEKESETWHTKFPEDVSFISCVNVVVAIFRSAVLECVGAAVATRFFVEEFPSSLGRCACVRLQWKESGMNEQEEAKTFSFLLIAST